jgi:hypothetical protein
MQYELHGRDDVEAAGTDADDLQITGIATDYVRITNMDGTQHVIYSLGPYDVGPPITPKFPDDWTRVEPGANIKVPMGAETQLNLRKKVYYRNIDWNPDETTRVLDVPVTVEVEQVNDPA